MLVTQKCRYALRAIFALARHSGQGPVKIAQVAAEQKIPFRFLEVILSQLKQGGFAESRRGTEGGYLLARDPAAISVGDIVRFVDGPIYPSGGRDEDMNDDEVFNAVWEEARDAVFEVIDNITVADLVLRDQALREDYVPNFEI